MKVFYFMGANPKINGYSWKIWKIERRKRTVRVWWARARIVKRKPVAAAKLQTAEWVFTAEKYAIEDERRRIASKLRKGYKRTFRRTSA